MGTPTDAPAPAARAALLPAIGLTSLLTAAVTAVVVLAVLTFARRNEPAGARAGEDAKLARDLDEPFVQRGTVKAEQAGGTVYFPVPYSSPPHLTLTGKSPDRKYVIARQDAQGFTWSVAVTLKDVRDVAGVLTGSDGKPLPADELTWEARGVRQGAGSASGAFEQTGSFFAPLNEEGEVYFPSPYALPPNVTLSGATVSTVKVVSCGPTGFAWKNTSSWGSAGTVTWTARGVRATPEQVAEMAKEPRAHGPGSGGLEQKGTFKYASGTQGEVGFERPYASPPNVKVDGSVVVSEIKTTGFKWQSVFKGAPTNAYDASWTAKGMPGKR